MSNNGKNNFKKQAADLEVGSDIIQVWCLGFLGSSRSEEKAELWSLN